MALAVAAPITAMGVGARAPATPTTAGCSTMAARSWCGPSAPRAVSTARAISSTSRKRPVITALVRILSTVIKVVPAMAARAVGRDGSPGISTPR